MFLDTSGLDLNLNVKKFKNFLSVKIVLTDFF